MAYVYRHIRNDINMPFYIGVGYTSDGKYLRSKIKANHSKEWKDIINITSYEIDILVDDLTIPQAYEKEKEFIALYGRKDLNKGELVNKTDGGRGATNGISKETRQKMVAKLRGRKMPEELKKRLSKIHMGKKVPWVHKPIMQFDLIGTFIEEFESISAAAKKLNITYSIIESCAIGRGYSAGGFIFIPKIDDRKMVTELVDSILMKIEQAKNRFFINGSKMSKRVKNLENGIIYDSISDASRFDGISRKKIGKYLKDENNSKYTYI